jgi:hypothetical protein
MVSFGRTHCDKLATDQTSTDPNVVADMYYDGERVYFQIADYTGDSSWNQCAQYAEKIYKDYVRANNGAVAGWYIFTRGLLLDWQRNGDVESKNALVLVSKNASYAGEATPSSWTQPELRSREVAYNIEAELDAERVGEPHRARTDLLISQALGHIDQWIAGLSSDGVTVPDFAPFMLGLTCDALIEANAAHPDSRILPKVIQGLEYAWQNAWIASANAFYYRKLTGTSPAPDLNLLIAPAYSWVWKQTGDSKWRDRADAIFAGGVAGAWLGNPKQFNQNYRLSFEYVTGR